MSAEQEIYNLYKQEFNIDSKSKQSKLLTEDEQIERYARNIAVWRRLEHEYNDDDLLKNITDVRLQHITK